ncbi:hypothetical protein B0T17DRAFT_629472 [Bombardia bombarda]|uniref:Uncharacterized protein n=1 Tax=Bombardia bombarda TaxID=252184 RepID=A0AA39WBI1_9PEZI|nr:hypothetical protein B0T17DRAFT_629472 [Bombardia bombarda]
MLKNLDRRTVSHMLLVWCNNPPLRPRHPPPPRRLLPPTAHAQTNDVTKLFVGQGQIAVLNSTSLAYASPADKIGCLSSLGNFTASAAECAVFTRIDAYPHTLLTTAGNCSFRNKNMPVNSDSVYGKNTHSWSCGTDKVETVPDETYYTVRGFNYPFLCNGNLDCFYDMKVPPAPVANSTSSVRVPVWQFVWGSDQQEVSPGHVQTVWLWVPVVNGTVSTKSR